MTRSLVLVCMAFVVPALAQEAQPDRDAARLNVEGVRLFQDGDFAGALKKFEEALGELPDEPSVQRYEIRLNQANAVHMLEDFTRARELYERLISEDPAHASTYRRELGVLLQKLRDRGLSTVSVSGEARLVRLVRGLLPRFPGIDRPIEVRLLSKEENGPEGLKQLGLETERVPIAQSTRFEDRSLILVNGELWAAASDAALSGTLAHELMHQEWLALGLDQALGVSGSEDTLRLANLEQVIDQLVMAKGFALELYRSKLFLLEHTDEGHLRGDLAPNAFHLADLLQRASAFQMPGAGQQVPLAPIPEEIAEDVKRRLEAFSWHAPRKQ